MELDDEEDGLEFQGHDTDYLDSDLENKIIPLDSDLENEIDYLDSDLEKEINF